MPKKALKKKRLRRMELRKLVLDGKGHNWQGNVVSFAGAKYLPGESNMERDLRAGYRDPTLPKRAKGKKSGGGSKSGGEQRGRGDVKKR